MPIMRRFAIVRRRIAIRLFVCGVFAAMHATPLHAQDPARADALTPFALTQVNVVDTIGGRIERNVTILVEGSRILRIDRAGW